MTAAAGLPAPPPYGSGTLADVLPSVAAGLGVPGFRDLLGLGDADRAVVLLVDGLGARLLRAHADAAPFLASLPSAVPALSAPFPSTTPAGLGSLGTGLPPGGHGLVGQSFRVPEWGRTLWPLGWKDEPNPVATQPEPTVLERAGSAGVAVSSVSPRAFRDSGLTRAVLRGTDYRGADSIGERVGEVVGAVRAGDRSLVYAYWGDLDRTGHVHGVDSDHWRADLAVADLLAARIAETLPSGAVMYVTADHGMVDCPDDRRVDLDADPRLREGVASLAGEPRARHVYARRGAADDVLAAWTEVLGDAAWVVSRDDAVAAGWFGETMPEYDDRIGDVVAVARDDIALASVRTDSLISGLRGQHGSLTPVEVEIPLLAVRA